MVNVVPGAGVDVVITSPVLSQNAGSRGQLIEQFEDAYGNPGAKSTTSQTISLSTTSSAGAFYASQASTTADHERRRPRRPEQHHIYYSDTKAGTPTLTVSDSALGSPLAQMETVNPAAAKTFTVTSSFANPDPAGTTGTVTVTAKDAYGNTVGSGPTSTRAR